MGERERIREMVEWTWCSKLGNSFISQDCLSICLAESTPFNRKKTTFTVTRLNCKWRLTVIPSLPGGEGDQSQSSYAKAISTSLKLKTRKLLIRCFFLNNRLFLLQENRPANSKYPGEKTLKFDPIMANYSCKGVCGQSEKFPSRAKKKNPKFVVTGVNESVTVLFIRLAIPSAIQNLETFKIGTEATFDINHNGWIFTLPHYSCSWK